MHLAYTIQLLYTDMPDSVVPPPPDGEAVVTTGGRVGVVHPVGRAHGQYKYMKHSICVQANNNVLWCVDHNLGHYALYTCMHVHVSTFHRLMRCTTNHVHTCTCRQHGITMSGKVCV